MSCGESVNIDALNEPGLMTLYHDVAGYSNLSRIEAVPNGTHGLSIDEIPAELQSVNDGNKYVIYFVNQLNRKERIEAIGHELGHLLLMSKYGLKPDFMFVQDQGTIQSIQNVTHHLILIDLLLEEYGISSNFHLSLMRKNLGKYLSDKDLPNDKALRFFEYEKLIRNVEGIPNICTQTKSFQKAYESAATRFGKYGFKHIPSPQNYKEDIISFLKDIGQIGKGCKI